MRVSVGSLYFLFTVCKSIRVLLLKWLICCSIATTATAPSQSDSNLTLSAESGWELGGGGGHFHWLDSAGWVALWIKMSKGLEAEKEAENRRSKGDEHWFKEVGRCFRPPPGPGPGGQRRRKEKG